MLHHRHSLLALRHKKALSAHIVFVSSPTYLSESSVKSSPWNPMSSTMADNREISFQSALRNVCEQLASKWNQQSMEDATVRAEHGLEPLQSYTINLDSANGNFTDPRLATVQGTVLLRWSPTLWKDIATQADENVRTIVLRLSFYKRLTRLSRATWASIGCGTGTSHEHKKPR